MTPNPDAPRPHRCSMNDIIALVNDHLASGEAYRVKQTNEPQQLGIIEFAYEPNVVPTYHVDKITFKKIEALEKNPPKAINLNMLGGHSEAVDELLKSELSQQLRDAFERNAPAKNGKHSIS